MSNDLNYLFKKEEIKTNGSYYYAKGLGKNEKPPLTPYEYGAIKSKRKRRLK